MPNRLLTTLLTAAVLWSCGGQMKTGDAAIPSDGPVALGKQLVEGIMACGSCHTSGNFVGDPDSEAYLAGDIWPGQSWGNIGVSNITPDVETGIGAWTDEEIIAAITKGISRNGRKLTVYMPWPDFGAALTGEEAAAIVAYLRSVPAAVSNAIPANELVMPFSDLHSKGIVFNMLSNHPAYTQYSADTSTPEGRGKRLAYLGACTACHAYAPEFPKPPNFSDPLAGGLEYYTPEGSLVICANLTPDVETGIGGFSDDELRTALKFGKRLRPLEGTEMVRWPMMQRMTHHTSLADGEIDDLIAYFRSMPAISHDISAKEQARKKR